MKRFYQVLPLCFLLSCATYYQMNLAFNQDFESGNMEAAEKVLVQNPKAADSKEKFLYYLNRGTVAAMLNKPEESNIYFEKAFIYGEDYRTNYFNEAGAYLLNPTIIEYKGEDHEHLILLYYKALNYIKLGDREAALVECRRLNNRLAKLNDKYKSDSKYKRDAFIHNLMGLIYDADRDYNNAFIAYRNSYDIYKEDYSKMFGVKPPKQLKKDLLRTAYLMGFQTELMQYEDEFKMKFSPDKKEGGDLIFLWNNGLGPVKDEFSINFTVVHGKDGLITFVNKERGYNFSFYMDTNDEEDEKKTDLSDLEFYRVAIPKYNERKPIFSNATLSVGKSNFRLEEAEDINKIAIYSLNQRMGLELSKSLLRLAIKKTAEKQLREESEGWGAALGAFNAFTEKADTRNWQTIPHTIYYTRARLPVGVTNAKLSIKSGKELRQEHDFTFHVQNDQTIFHSFYSLESVPQSRLY
ncbi:hypothetical protein SAMN04488029_0186 [Reichenbachiella faecimaris]|uniref:Tetratricopeptide repeat-containing protein n=1 Tax=Reichenbachiella faecimaris TaxID=692418 RepID=A0A1W2G656_REIFA|nr:hypothetical protein [Reichenbachiella faecimaris]SMD31848.1 hypothetical protein SAMN04488029_0186 [Reichenbachiella faecimaris]